MGLALLGPPMSAGVRPPRCIFMPPTASISDLPSLGPKSQQALMAAGIDSVTRLRELGSVAAYWLAKQRTASVSLNLLWALEGALTGVPWQVVARKHRTSLLLALDALQHRETLLLTQRSRDRC